MELMTTTMVQEHSQHAYDRGDYKQSPHLHFGLDLEMASKHGIKQELLYDSPPPSDMGVHGHGTMRKMVNKLGGTYCSGKPLSLATRRQIVDMAESGLKACDISRQLQISHGCVSKIITKWRSTGSFEPRRIGGSKPKKTIGDVVAAVRMYKRAAPSMRSLEIRRRLLEDGVCTEYNVPSLSSINRIIRMKLRDDLAEFEANAVRDLMAILAGTAMPAVQDQQQPSQADTASMQGSPFSEESEEPEESQSPEQLSSMVPQSMPQHHAGGAPCKQNLTYFGSNMTSLPTQQLACNLTPPAMDDKPFQMPSGIISKSRCSRNGSAASTSSTSSSYTDASFEAFWSDDLALSNDDPHRMYSAAAYCNPIDLANLNFDDNDLWSLLDELP